MVQVGTLSKTLGALGGFVAGPQPFIDLLVNRARSYIFTTAVSPADAAAALAALGIITSPEGELLRTRLRSLVDKILPGHPTPIIPIILGEERRAVEASRALLDQGLLVPAIRPPSVPPGSSRLRVALSAIHTDEQIADLAQALARLPGGTS
jgi:7-keto-8-aminopelargonate synthetase-like enzyme